MTSRGAGSLPTRVSVRGPQVRPESCDTRSVIRTASVPYDGMCESLLRGHHQVTSLEISVKRGSLEMSTTPGELPFRVDTGWVSRVGVISRVRRTFHV